MSDSSNDTQSEQDVELNDAFARLEKQVAENQEKETESKGPVPRKTNGKTTTPSSSGSGFGGIVALLFALVALGLGSYSAYTTYLLSQNSSTSESETQALANRLSLAQTELAELKAEQSNTNQTIRQEIESLLASQASGTDEIEARVDQSIAELRQQIGTTSEDWLLAEAEYLLRLANQRVLMEDDIAGAISLFEAADKIVKDAEGIVAFSLRKAIADDIAKLQAVSVADVDGIFVQLGALANQIPALQQKTLEYKAELEAPASLDAERTFAQSVQYLAHRFWLKVESLVDYRRDGEVVTPILPPGEEYYLKQNLLLKIQLGQLGLLRGNQEIYQQSLRDASAWVKQYFDQEQARTISVMNGLEALSTVQVARETPDVSSSLREIRKLMANFHKAESLGASS